jgi:hypothetical protein
MIFIGLVVIMVTVVMVLVLLMKQRILPMPHVSVMIIQRDNHIVRLSRIHPPQTRIHPPQTRIHPQTSLHLHLHPKVGDKKIEVDKIPVVNNKKEFRVYWSN